MQKIKELIIKYKSIILYLIFGVLSTIVSIGLYALCTRVFHFGYYISNFISWIGAVTFAYFTNKGMVFESEASTIFEKLKEFIMFYLARVFTLLVELLLLKIGIDFIHINDLIVKVVANFIVIVLNYILSKFIIFTHLNERNKKMNMLKTYKKYKKIFGRRRAFIKTLIWKLQLKEKKLDQIAISKYKDLWEENENICHKKIDELFENPKYKYIFVFYPYTEWNLPIFQRPQQIALALTENRDDVLYFYCTINFNYDSIDRLEKINENLYVTTEYEYLMEKKTDKRILHLYSTDIVSSISDIEESFENHDKILYEYIDEIHEDITQDIPKHFIKKHNRVLKNEDYYVVTTADKLYDDVKNIRKNRFILANNGVKVEDFVNTNGEIPNEIINLKKKYEKIICYYGALAKWFDYELLEKCAKKYKNYCFMLIGIEYDNSLKESKILQNNKNIVYIGKVDYKNLVNYAKNVDLLTIPFLINDVTKSTSPVKLFEYMALQVPILTTDLLECRKYESVNIGKNHEEYINKIPKVMELKNDDKYKELELKEANENSWSKISSDIIKLIDSEE